MDTRVHAHGCMGMSTWVWAHGYILLPMAVAYGWVFGWVVYSFSVGMVIFGGCGHVGWVWSEWVGVWVGTA